MPCEAARLGLHRGLTFGRRRDYVVSHTGGPGLRRGGSGGARAALLGTATPPRKGPGLRARSSGWPRPELLRKSARQLLRGLRRRAQAPLQASPASFDGLEGRPPTFPAQRKPLDRRHSHRLLQRRPAPQMCRASVRPLPISPWQQARALAAPLEPRAEDEEAWCSDLLLEQHQVRPAGLLAPGEGQGRPRELFQCSFRRLPPGAAAPSTAAARPTAHDASCCRARQLHAACPSGSAPALEPSRQPPHPSHVPRRRTRMPAPAAPASRRRA